VQHPPVVPQQPVGTVRAVTSLNDCECSINRFAVKIFGSGTIDVVDPEGCPFQVFECRAEGCDFEQIGGDEKAWTDRLGSKAVRRRREKKMTLPNWQRGHSSPRDSTPLCAGNPI